MPGMKKRKFGRIINIASAHGLAASAEKVAYVAAKHGIVGLTKVVAIETANDGITCNAICPGWVLTPLVQAQIEARAKAQGKLSSRRRTSSSPRSSRCSSTRRRRTSARSRCFSRRRCSRDDHRLVLPDRRRLDRAVARGSRLSSPAKAGDPVDADLAKQAEVFTGCPAFAGHDA